MSAHRLYAWKNEGFDDHVESMLTLWGGLFRRTHLACISRVLALSSEEAEYLVRKMVILHDVGKLYIEYQKAITGSGTLNRAEYRHEIVSAYYMYNLALSTSMNEEDYCAMTAIALHHEPILMGQLARMGEPYLTVTDILRRLRKTSIEGKILMDRDGIKLVEDLLRKYVGINVQLPVEVTVEEVANAMRDIILTTSIKGSTHYKARIRLKTSALLSLLCVLDSWPAHKARREDDGGNFIARRAELAEVALVWLS